MLFNSGEFIFLLLPAALICFYGFARLRLIQLSLWSLVTCSFIFYGWLNTPITLLLAFSVVFNYLCCRQIIASQTRHWVIVGIAVNLLILGYFKYRNFFLENLTVVSGWNFDLAPIYLPLGISFYTFQAIGYLVDAHKGKVHPHSFVEFATFLTFFPQLVAGPIVHHGAILPQLRSLRIYIFNYRHFSLGFALFILGLSKKMLIADHFALWVHEPFSTPDGISFFASWAAVLSYTFQLYFDFSGYSDMAMGLGLMFNIQYPLNFNSPYKAASASEFWHRWHITLSHFLRDYVYIPLGGNRVSTWRLHFNLLATMVLGGIWHGAAWTFVLWGFLHGMFLSINHAWKSVNFTLPRIVGWLLTFPCIVVGWAIFRANSLGDAWEIIKGMIGLNGFVLSPKATSLLYPFEALGVTVDPAALFVPRETQAIWLLAALTVVIFLPNSWQISRHVRPNIWWGLLLIILLIACTSKFDQTQEFLYFNF